LKNNKKEEINKNVAAKKGINPDPGEFTLPNPTPNAESAMKMLKPKINRLENRSFI